MNPIVAIIYDSLIFARLTYWSHYSINKTKQFSKGDPLAVITLLYLSSKWGSTMVSFHSKIRWLCDWYVVDHVVVYHAKQWYRFRKSSYHVGVSAKIAVS